jgi:hypothetical protein
MLFVELYLRASCMFSWLDASGQGQLSSQHNVRWLQSKAEHRNMQENIWEHFRTYPLLQKSTSASLLARVAEDCLML